MNLKSGFIFIRCALVIKIKIKPNNIYINIHILNKPFELSDDEIKWGSQAGLDTLSFI